MTSSATGLLVLNLLPKAPSRFTTKWLVHVASVGFYAPFETLAKGRVFDVKQPPSFCSALRW